MCGSHTYGHFLLTTLSSPSCCLPSFTQCSHFFQQHSEAILSTHSPTNSPTKPFNSPSTTLRFIFSSNMSNSAALPRRIVKVSNGLVERRHVITENSSAALYFPKNIPLAVLLIGALRCSFLYCNKLTFILFNFSGNTTSYSGSSCRNQCYTLRRQP